ESERVSRGDCPLAVRSPYSSVQGGSGTRCLRRRRSFFWILASTFLLSTGAPGNEPPMNPLIRVAQFAVSLVAAFVFAGSAADAQSYQIIRQLLTPAAALVQGADGNFYGVTAFGAGTVFKLTTAGTLTT